MDKQLEQQISQVQNKINTIKDNLHQVDNDNRQIDQDINALLKQKRKIEEDIKKKEIEKTSLEVKRKSLNDTLQSSQLKEDSLLKRRTLIIRLEAHGYPANILNYLGEGDNDSLIVQLDRIDRADAESKREKHNLKSLLSEITRNIKDNGKIESLKERNKLEQQRSEIERQIKIVSTGYNDPENQLEELNEQLCGIDKQLKGVDQA